MGRTSSSKPGNPKRRTRPRVEGLEQRWVPSQAAGGMAIAPASSPLTGEFFHNYQQFNYTTPQGTHVELKFVGRGSFQGTSVDSSGALHLLFSKTNSYTKITSNVHGGTGQADLASIYSADLYNNYAVTSLSGIGGTVLAGISLPNFNLIPGGIINLTAGIDNLNLNSAGPNSQIEMRYLPQSTSSSSTSSSSSSTTNTSSSSTTGSASSTTQGTSSTISSGTSQNNNSSIIVTGAFTVQSLAGISGEFITAGNIVNVTTNGTPPPPPAPPGVVLKINHINGNITTPPNLLTDKLIFGYDAATGQVVRFNITPTIDAAAGNVDMARQTGTIDPTWTPIQVQAPGATSPVAISVGRDGPRLVLLVSTGSKIYTFDATYGTPIGSFTAPAGFTVTTMGSTDTLTVLGDTATNKLEMIDIPRSLAAGTAEPPVNPSPFPQPFSYTPPAGFTLVGGLTGLVGSNQVYPTIAATFNSFQPSTTELGLLTASTSNTIPNAAGGLTLVRSFGTVSEQAIKVGSNYIPVNPSSNPGYIGVSEGSVDSSLAINTLGASTTTPTTYSNHVTLLGPSSLTNRGTITLKTTDPITDLSESFRADLTGSTANGPGPVVVDVQGTLQSLRGLSANGLVLNNTGYLNLIRTGTISNSTILAQPIGHILTPQSKRSNVLLISTNNRDFGHRGGVNYLAAGLYQVGPLALTNDRPAP